MKIAGPLATAALIALPVLGQPIILIAPDQRAIALLTSATAGRRWQGTGTVIGEAALLTARHVSTERMQVYLPAAVVMGQVTCQESRADLAVVAAELVRGDLRYRVSLRLPVVGEIMTVGGYPKGDWAVEQATVTEILAGGRIGGVQYDLPVLRLRSRLGPGASGAPVLDRHGRVVAVLIGGARDENFAFPLGTGLQQCRAVVLKYDANLGGRP